MGSQVASRTIKGGGAVVVSGHAAASPGQCWIAAGILWRPPRSAWLDRNGSETGEQRHADKFGKAAGGGLGHDMGPVDFNRARADS